MQRRRPVVAHVPASHGEAAVVGVVVEMVVGEDEVTDVYGVEAGAHHLVSAAGAAVEHDAVVADLEDGAGAKAVAGGNGKTAADERYLGQSLPSGLV